MSRMKSSRYDRNRRKYERSFGVLLALILAITGVKVGIVRHNSHSGYYENNGTEMVHDGNYADDSIEFAADEYSESTCTADSDSIPDYFGADYVVLNGGIPNFTQYDYDHISGQSFSKLDRLGRCGTAIAMIDRFMVPTEERGSIGSITPTGWVQNKYEGIVDSRPPYLYNRCHLIAYALTGENANERNLITGTRYMNATVMLPWEKKVMRYLDYSDNHVLYRVTPYFVGKELLSRGVEMEAYSIEDNGEGVCFHIFVYNVQPGIVIDYKTGDNSIQK